METKICKSCLNPLPLGAFTKHSILKSGLASKCRQCAAASRPSRAMIPRVPGVSIKRGPKPKPPEQLKPPKRKPYSAEDYQKLQKERAKAYYLANKGRILEVNKRYAKRNPSIVNAATRRWMDAHPERVKAARHNRRVSVLKNGGPKLTPEVVAALWHKQKGLCIICRVKLGKGPQDTGAYHVDHIHPISKGGTNDSKNLQCLCPFCNASKGAKLPNEYAQTLGRLFI